MKKLILIIYILLSGGILFAETIDSTKFYNAISTGIEIGKTIVPEGTVLGLPNNVISVILTTICAFVLHLIRVKTVRKKVENKYKRDIQ